MSEATPPILSGENNGQSVMDGIKRRTTGLPKRDIRSKSAPDGIPSHLPLVHVTAVGAALEIIEAGQLEMTLCPVFKKDLLYFFVLRPAYRMAESDAKSDQINRFPFVFIVDPQHLTAPHHVYPFDTGGAFHGVFGDWPDPYVRLEDYELLPDLSAASGLIGWAFGSAINYFEGKVKPDLKKSLSPWESAAQSYLKIAGLATSGGGRNRPDKRASAIEVAYAQHVALKDNAVFAILPKQLLESGQIKNADFMAKLQATGMNWEIYDWHPNSSPDDFFDEVSKIARDYFKARVPL